MAKKRKAKASKTKKKAVKRETTLLQFGDEKEVNCRPDQLDASNHELPAHRRSENQRGN